MTFKEFLNSWKGLKWENYWSRIVIFIQSLAILALIVVLVGEKSIVTVAPPALSEKAVLRHNAANEGFHNSMGLYVANLLGNTTPQNAEIVRESLGHIVAPNIYSDFMKVLDDQIAMIRRDRVASSFEAKRVAYEHQSNKVFVTGTSVVSGLSDRTTRTERTYEFVFNISNYQPFLTSINTYEGPARDAEWLNRNNQA